MRGLKIALLCALLLCPFHVSAADDYVPAEDNSAFQVDEGQGIALTFAGEREEGALEFFVKKDSASGGDPTANDLNNIAPAAGIQFRFEF